MFDRRKIARDRRAAERTPAVFAVKKSFAGRISLCQAEDIGTTGITIRRPRGRTDDPPCFYGYLPRGMFRALKNAIEQNQRLGKVRTVKRSE